MKDKRGRLVGHIILVSSPDPTPHEGKRGLETLVEFLGILNVSSHVTITYSDPLAQRVGSTRDPTARISDSPQSK